MTLFFETTTSYLW